MYFGGFLKDPPTESCIATPITMGNAYPSHGCPCPPSASVLTAPYCWGPIGLRGSSLGQDFFLKHPRLPLLPEVPHVMVPGTPLTLHQEDCSFPDALGPLAAVSCSRFLRFMPTTSPCVPIFRAHTESSPCGLKEPLSLCIRFRRSSHPQPPLWVERGGRRGDITAFPKTFSQNSVFTLWICAHLHTFSNGLAPLWERSMCSWCFSCKFRRSCRVQN